MNNDTVSAVISILMLVFVFGFALTINLKDAQEQNAKEAMPLTHRNTTNHPIGTGGFGAWSNVALWLIVIFLGLNVCLMFSMRNQTANLHKDIHKIMGLSAPNLTDCQDRINRERLY